MYRILLISLLFISCQDHLDTWVTYKIKKGSHNAGISSAEKLVRSVKDGRHMHFSARFSEGTLYEPVDDDLNKLYGFVDCNSSVHRNSARFAWRHDGEGSIEIFAYVYREGERVIKPMGETHQYISDDYEIWAKNDWYRFKFNNKWDSIERFQSCEKGLRVRLWPYFGGSTTSPNDMYIMIKEYD